MKRVVRMGMIAVAMSVTGLAHAETDPADLVAARQLASEGIKLAEANDCPAAIEKFRRAEAIFHAPTILVRLAECQRTTGQVVEAYAAFDRVSRERLAPNAPPAFVSAQERAVVALAELSTRVGKLRVDVLPAGRAVKVLVDGVPLKESLLGVERIVAAGNHTIEAYDDLGRASKTVAVAAKASVGVMLTLPAQPLAKVGRPSLAPSRPPSAKVASSSGGYGPFGWGMTFGGIGSLAAGSVLLGMTLSSKSELEQNCPGRVCPISEQGRYDDARTTATLSVIALGVGAVALTTGIFVLATKGSRSKAAEASSFALAAR